MGQHPSDEELQAFLAGALPAVARNAVLLHLNVRCPRCRRRLAGWAERTLGAGRAAPASDYDSALDRAFAVARSREESLAGERREAERLA